MYGKLITIVIFKVCYNYRMICNKRRRGRCIFKKGALIRGKVTLMCMIHDASYRAVCTAVWPYLLPPQFVTARRAQTVEFSLHITSDPSYVARAVELSLHLTSDQLHSLYERFCLIKIAITVVSYRMNKLQKGEK